MVEVRIGGATETLTHEDFEARMRAGRVPPDAAVRIRALTGEAFVPAAELPWSGADRVSVTAVAWIPPLLTALLVGVQVRLYFASWLPRVEQFVSLRLLSYAPRTFEDGEIWRPITMGFLQVNLLHLTANMLWLAYVGWTLERTLGRANLLVVYLASVVTGSLFSTFATPMVPSLGASGGVFGLVGAVVSFGFVRRDLVGERLSFAFGASMLPYLLLTFLSGLSNTGVDNWCHLGGMLSGLALGLLLDPPSHQRRPAWNLGAGGAVAALGVGALAAIGVAGPRIEPLDDAEAVRASARAREGATPAPLPEGPRPLRYRVPAGWRPAADPFGGAGFGNPLEPRRGFGATERGHERSPDPAALAEESVERLLADWPAAEIDPPREVPVAGRPGILVRAVTDDREVEIRLATRGLRSLRVVWQCDRPRCARLAPLRDRLVAAVDWGDPADLARARADHARAVTPRTRLALASALVRAGEAEEGFALYGALAAEAPTSGAPLGSDLWREWLGDLVAVRAPLEEVARTAERAVGEPLAPKAVVAAADALEEAGDRDAAVGLLVLAWERAPGDRTLARARRARRLPDRLVGGVPWENVVDPVTRTPRRRPLRDAPLDIAAARVAGREIADARAALAEAAARHFAVHDAALIEDLVVLATGGLPEGDARDAALAALESASAPLPPDWLPPGTLPADVGADPWFAALRAARVAAP